MPLEDLLELVETLRTRIGEHGPLLSQNETRTRYALIDPLLWGVGWDTEDPAQVVPEYALAPKSADYALLGSDGRPTMIVEAKRLDRPLRDGLSQSIAYCVEQGTPYFCVTDGRRWAIYETFRQVPVDKKLVVEFDLVADSPAEVCLKALALWRPSVDGGQVRVAQTPVVRTGAPEPPPSSPTKTISHPPAAAGGWITLAGQRPGKGAKKPVEVLCPPGEHIQVQNWHGLRRQIVKWLVERGHLAAAEAKDPDYHMNAANEVKRAEANIKQAKLEPADFKVRLAD